MTDENSKPPLATLSPLEVVAVTKSQQQEPSESSLPLDSEGKASLAPDSVATTPDSPKLKSKHARRVTEAEYYAVYEDWKIGELKLNQLARKHGLSWMAVRDMVVIGKKQMGLCSFEDRLKAEKKGGLNDAQVAQVTAIVASAALDEWEKAKEEDVKLLTVAKAILHRLMMTFVREIPGVTFTRKRREKDKNGAWHTIDVPLDGLEAACVADRLATFLDKMIKAECLILGKPTERIEQVTGQQGGVLSLTDQQLEQLGESGILPPGVSDDVLFGRAALRDMARRFGVEKLGN